MSRLKLQDSNLVPELRFVEFCGFWECTRVDEISDGNLANGVFNDPKKVGTGYYLINVKDMYKGLAIRKEDLSRLELSESEFEKNKVKFGDLFFTRSSLVKEGIAYSAINVSYDEDITYDGHLIKLSPKLSDYDAMFLGYCFRTLFVRKQIISRGKTGTMTTIGQNDLVSVKVPLPLIKEQQKIAKFLTSVDQRISLLKQKKVALETYKKGLMQKIFNQEIRFKDKNGHDYPDWDDKKFTYSFPNVTNGFVGTATPYYRSYGICYIQGKNIKRNDIDPKGMIYVNDEFHLKQKKSQLKENDILMVQSGHVGECVVVPKQYEGANCHALLIAKPNGRSDSKFIVFYFNSFYGRKMLWKLTTGNTIKHILASDLKKTTLPFPTLKEQQKIADFLSSMDQSINKLKNQIEQTIQFKKGLLQRMFV